MSLLDLFPGKWAIYAGIMVGTFVAGGTTAWKFQSMRYEAKENERAQHQLATEREWAKNNARQISTVSDALGAATARAGTLRRDADAARSSADSLRDATAAALRAAATDQATCIERTTTFSELFTASVRAYQGMAATADRHVSDVKTLNDAWPK
jgi:hypothetical protein